MRLEKVIAQALEKVGFDRYLLASAVGKRAQELSKGSEPLVKLDKKNAKYADIALYEIAQGKIVVSIEG